MTSRSFTGALATALNPPPVDVFGAPGCVPAREQQHVHDATESSVLPMLLAERARSRGGRTSSPRPERRGLPGRPAGSRPSPLAALAALTDQYLTTGHQDNSPLNVAVPRHLRSRMSAS
jgi:hypothetical protein